MAVDASLLPLSLDPLIADAKRRALRRRFLLILAAAALGGGGTAGAILASASSFTPTRPVQSALLSQSSSWSGVPFASGRTFSITLLLGNHSGQTITLERASAVLPSQAPFRQIGTRITAYRACPQNASCADPTGVAYVPPTVRPPDVTPGHLARATLDFQLKSCPAVSRQPVRTVTVVYRTADGTAVHQRLRAWDSVSIRGLPRHPRCS